ncbi:hydrolase [Halobacillus litoralis]|uniref:Hydrolase n=1 Tax=Halobacillus litoralis TaxID=45668 RepID=A0A410MGR9_9BACI|nr:hydrolase [Halobacillus litoralis]QAS53880.1 hydrolase [Halobacillus litoralis]
MDRDKYYINIGTREISLNHDGNNDDFLIYATKEEVITLREIFDEIYNSDVRSFYRAHVPFKPYHQDEDNDESDMEMKHAFQKIYDLGDETTKNHIVEMGVLED